MHPRHSLGRGVRPFALALSLSFALATGAGAQNATENDVARAKRLVNAGERVAAQSLAASMLARYAEGTNEYADALYVRALSANSAADAERDYLRVSIEYPLSPRGEDALMMVGQLRYARGDRSGARRAFERLTRDHPTGEQAAKASYWYGRLALDDGDGAQGCPALQRAQSMVSDDDVELKNQIDFHVRRCRTPGGIPVRDTTPLPPPPKGGVAKATPKPPTPTRRPVPDAPRPVLPPRDSAIVTEPAPPDTARTDTVAALPPRVEPPPAPLPPAAPAKEWSVQVAAFPKERDARALSEVLAQRGYQARVWGARPPYRVRVGRYATREDAESALGRMKRSRLNGVVVEAEPQ